MTVEEVKLMGFVGLGLGWHFRVLQTPIRKYCRNFTEISFKLMENFRRQKWKNNKKENSKKKKKKTWPESGEVAAGGATAGLAAAAEAGA